MNGAILIPHTTSKLLELQKIMVTLVSTVFNDRTGLKNLFGAMEDQTLPPDEIVIVDAGSNDGTWELLQEEQNRRDRPWKMVAICQPICNVARGRNLAIEAARGEIIVSTDIGCDWDAEWLEELVRPLESNPAIGLVIGSWLVKKGDLHGQWAMVEWAMKGDQRLEATAKSYSSSRSIAYRKTCWEALGRYPEDLTFAGDDALFHFLIEKAEVPRVGAPKVRCYWHRHSTLQGFLKESYRYGIGAGEAGVFLKDAVLVGARMGFEVVCLASALILLPIYPIVGLVAILLGLASLALRLKALMPAARRLKAEGVCFPLAKVFVFIYLNKLHWIRGVIHGWLAGAKKCEVARSRIGSLSPELYRKRIGKI